MSYLVSALGITVMAACLIALWRSTFEEQSRQPHLILLFAGQLIVTWSSIAPVSWCWTWWWEIATAIGLTLLIAGLARLTWFMWLRNGHLSGE